MKINERFSIRGEPCTVRFVGHISEWPHDVAVGVEWDNASRGKNDGSLNGNRYFYTSQNAKSGSFIKKTKFELSEKPRRGFLMEKILERYGDVSYGDESLQMRFGTKTAESLGFSKLSELNSKVEMLHSISMDHAAINGVEENDLPRFGAFLSLKRLDLSYNLFSKSVEILEFVSRHCPTLEYLNLTSNNFVCEESYNTVSDVPKCVSVKSLSLQSNKLRPSTLKLCCCAFPNLETLNLTDNALSCDWKEDFLDPLSGLKNLREIDLSCNEFNTFPWFLAEIPATSVTLNLSGNSLEYLDKQNSKVWDGIVSLNVCGTNIARISDFDTLFENMPNLKHLQLKDSLVMNKYKDDLELRSKYAAMSRKHDFETFFYNEVYNLFLFRFPESLESLDWSPISDNDRVESELYFVSQFPTQKFDDFSGKRREQLVEKYHLNKALPSSAEKYEHETLGSQLVKIVVLAKFSTSELVFTCFQNTSILAIKGLCKQQLNLKSVLELKLVHEVWHKGQLLKSEDMMDYEDLSHYRVENNERLYLFRQLK